MLVKEGVVPLADGKTLKYRVDHTSVKGEDDYVICPDLAAALHALAKQPDQIPRKIEESESDSSSADDLLDQFPRRLMLQMVEEKESDDYPVELEKVDFKELGDWVQETYGQISLFAVLDGHVRAPTSFMRFVVPAFALELKQTLPTDLKNQSGLGNSNNNKDMKDQETDEMIDPVELQKSKVELACFRFPRRFHNYVKADWLRSMYAQEGGSTFSFSVIFQDEMFLGVIGDSPAGAVLKDKADVLVDLQYTNSADCQVWPNVRVESGNFSGNYYIAYPYCQGDVLVNNAIGDFVYDAEVQELLFDFEKDREKRKEIATKYPAIQSLYQDKPKITFSGIRRRPSFEPIPFVFDQRPHLQRVALDELVGAFVVTDGVFDRYHHECVREALNNWAEWDFNKILASFAKTPLRYRDDATSILFKMV